MNVCVGLCLCGPGPGRALGWPAPVHSGPPQGVGHDWGLQLVCDVLFLKLEGKTQGVFTLFIIFLYVSEITCISDELKRMSQVFL